MRKERIMEEADEELEFSEQGGNPSGEAWQDAGRNQARVVKRTTASLRERLRAGHQSPQRCSVVWGGNDESAKGCDEATALQTIGDPNGKVTGTLTSMFYN